MPPHEFEKRFFAEKYHFLLVCLLRIRANVHGVRPHGRLANVGTVKFVRGDADRNYGLVVKDDGRYIAKGMTIIVK